MLFSKRIKILRQKQSLRQEEVAEQLKCSVEEVDSWESGYSLPNDEKIKEISTLYHVSISRLNDSKQEQIMYNDEKSLSLIWIFKKYTIIAYILLFLIPVLFSILVMAHGHVSKNSNLSYIIYFLVVLGCISSLLLHLYQVMKLLDASTSGLYKIYYTNHLKLYSYIFLILFILVIICIPIMIYA